MATPVIDLRQRLREADLTEAQADAIAAGFELLDRKIDGLDRRLSARLDRHDAMFRLLLAMQLVTLGAVLAPYVGRPFVAG